MFAESGRSSRGERSCVGVRVSVQRKTRPKEEDGHPVLLCLSAWLGVREIFRISHSPLVRSNQAGKQVRGRETHSFPRPPEPSQQLDTISTRYEGVHTSSALSSTSTSISCDMPQQKTTMWSRGQRQDSWAAVPAKDRCSQQPVFSITLQLNLLHHPQHTCLDQHPMNLCSPAVPLLAHAASPGLKPCSAAAPCPLFLGLPFCPCQVESKASEHSWMRDKQPVVL